VGRLWAKCGHRGSSNLVGPMARNRTSPASVSWAGIPPLQLSRFMGHAKVTTTLSIYTHLFDDDHAETMAALEAMSRPLGAPNVVEMRRRG
jgi:hypothetical protein